MQTDCRLKLSDISSLPVLFSYHTSSDEKQTIFIKTNYLASWEKNFTEQQTEKASKTVVKFSRNIHSLFTLYTEKNKKNWNIFRLIVERNIKTMIPQSFFLYFTVAIVAMHYNSATF